VAAGDYHTIIGLKVDGTVVAVGWNDYGQCDTFDWNLRLPSVMPRGIQITGTSSNIMTNVHTNNTVQFTVHVAPMPGANRQYRFFTRAGYGQPDWGGNKWTLVQDFSPANSVSVTFDEPGIYFLVGHVERFGETWEFGDPQTGIAVEVSDPLGTGIQIIGTSTNIEYMVEAGDTVQFIVPAVADASVGVIHYRFYTRAGYGYPDWGGNTWTLVQDFSPVNLVSVTFNDPGIYFLACHAERAGEAWGFGDPQTGIVVEVWPVQ